MAEIIDEEKVFENFLEVPENVRMRMIEKMKPDDRCRITRCSKLCNKEAKASKNYVHHLCFRSSPEDLRIHVKFGKMPSITATHHGYCLKFSETQNGKFKKCIGMEVGKVWEDQLDDSTDLDQLAVEEFKILLNSHQKTVEWLVIKGFSENTRSIGLEVESLDNLDYFRACGQVDIPCIFSKLRKPLKTLEIEQEAIDSYIIARCEQIYQVQTYIYWPFAQLNDQQLFQLSARDIYIGIGQITQRAIFKFIRAWQDGTIGREIDHYRFRSLDWNFDNQKLLRLLRIENIDELRRRFEISVEVKHYNNAGKKAILSCDNRSLTFHVPYRR